jgi:two-component system CheB/CheR fusion protein
VQGLLSRGDHIAVTLRELVHMEIGALGAQVDGARIVVDGSDVPLPNASVQLLALALHELATNALKYGVLDSSEGRLEVKWREEACDGRQPHLVLEWIESGLDRRDESGAYRRGFGRELIERALPYQLDAITHYELTRDGVRCSIEIPLTGNDGAGRQDADR